MSGRQPKSTRVEGADIVMQSNEFLKRRHARILVLEIHSASIDAHVEKEVIPEVFIDLIGPGRWWGPPAPHFLMRTIALRAAICHIPPW
jgi:hypothetical protein